MKIINQHIFEHHVFDKKAIQAQQDFDKIQGVNNTYLYGAYLRYGFHEDGILNVAAKLEVTTPCKGFCFKLKSLSQKTPS